MNPSPTPAQMALLHRVKEGCVFFGGGDWWVRDRLRDVKVTGTVRRLWQLGFIQFPAQISFRSKPSVTSEGTEMLAEVGLK